MNESCGWDWGYPNAGAQKRPVCRLEILEQMPSLRRKRVNYWKLQKTLWFAGCLCRRKQDILTLAVKLAQYEYASEARGKAKFCIGPRHGGSAGSDATWNIGGEFELWQAATNPKCSEMRHIVRPGRGHLSGSSAHFSWHVAQI